MNLLERRVAPSPKEGGGREEREEGGEARRSDGQLARGACGLRLLAVVPDLLLGVDLSVTPPIETTEALGALVPAAQWRMPSEEARCTEGGS